jgi:hypothetical protein
MADNLPDAMETNLLDYFLKTANSTNFTPPGSLWVGLCTSAPTETATNECATSNYARVQMPLGAVVASGGTIGLPTVAVNFAQATSSWATGLAGYVVCAASTGSTGTSQYLFYGAISPTVAVTTNDTVSFAANAITLSFA